MKSVSALLLLLPVFAQVALGKSFRELNAFPECDGRARWVQSNWEKHSVYGNSGVDGSIESIKDFLGLCETHCPKPEGNTLIKCTCEDHDSSSFKECQGRMDWMSIHWDKAGHSYKSKGVDGSLCSIQAYLSECEKTQWCPKTNNHAVYCDGKIPVETPEPQPEECEGPYGDEFPECAGRANWMLSNNNWKRELYSGLVDGSRCSIVQYLSTCEGENGKGYCPHQAGVKVPDCQREKPTDPPASSESVSIVAHNLFWWNLFGKQNGGNFFNKFKEYGPYDVMLFQECDDPARIVNGLSYKNWNINWGRGAVNIAYNGTKFSSVSQGWESVAEDRPEQYYGHRYAVYNRLQQKSNDKVLFVVSVHGPLMVNTGGAEGGYVYAQKLVDLINRKSESGDYIVLAGDFNNEKHVAALKELQKHYKLVASDWVDHILIGKSNASPASTQVVRNTGSDHRGLKAIINL